MTEEEKKAIEYFKDDINYLEEELKRPNFLGRFITIRDKECKMLKILLNLIEKLQKENEELKEKNKTLELANTLRSYCKIDELANDFNYYKNLANAYQANSISKDKIKEKIKQLENKREQLEIFKSGIYSSGIYKISLIIAAYKELLEEE